jgi:hypothetical protein
LGAVMVKYPLVSRIRGSMPHAHGRRKGQSAALGLPATPLFMSQENLFGGILGRHQSR